MIKRVLNSLILTLCTACSLALADPAQVMVQTDLMTVFISAAGGTLDDVRLARVADGDGLSVEHALPIALHSGLTGRGSPGHKSLFVFDGGNLVMGRGEQTADVSLRSASSGPIRVSKTYQFHRGSYLIDQAIEVANVGTESESFQAYFEIEREIANKAQTASFSQPGYLGPAYLNESEGLIQLARDDIDKGSVSASFDVMNGWAAMLEPHFGAILSPEAGAEWQGYVRRVGPATYAIGVKGRLITLEPGESVRLQMPTFTGPLQWNALAATDRELTSALDLGTFSIIAKPLLRFMHVLERITGNWGWSIVLLTLLIKLGFWRLTRRSYAQMKRVEAMAPKVRALREAHQGDKKSLHAKTVELYTSEEVHPLGGCLPLLVQIPVFLALYSVLINSVEMRGAPWIGWIQDLSAPDPLYVLPIAMGITMLAQARMHPAQQETWRTVLGYALPVLFSAAFVYLPAGLVLYWVTNNLVSLVQHVLIHHEFHLPPADGPQAVARSAVVEESRRA